MLITTCKGKTFEANYAFAPTSKGTCILELKDERPIEEIAKDFDGIAKIERKSESEGDKTYEGYSVLSGVNRDTRRGTVQITLEKPE